jgi:hypothetical protein
MDITDNTIKNYVNLYFNQQHLEEVKTHEGEHFNSLPPIGEWDVSKVTNMSRLFEGRTMEILDIHKWDVSNVTDMNHMFSDCENLRYIDVEEWPPSSVEWDVSKVTDMSYMFNNCKSLLDVPYIGRWDVSNVEDMRFMFKGCTKMNSHTDLRGWKLKKLKQWNHIFDGWEILEIFQPDFYSYALHDMGGKRTRRTKQTSRRRTKSKRYRKTIF